MKNEISVLSIIIVLMHEVANIKMTITAYFQKGNVWVVSNYNQYKCI